MSSAWKLPEELAGIVSFPSGMSVPVADAVAFLRGRAAAVIDVGLILGTGLCDVAESILDPLVIPYGDIPGFREPTAVGHHGRMTIGRLGDRVVAALQGRCHLYEGCPASYPAFPVRVLSALGMKTLIVTNAAGGLHPDHQVGDLMILSDHINMMFANPLIGPHEESFGPMFPDMSAPYDRELSLRAMEIARRENVQATRGVYAAVTGPNYETRAEMRMYRRLGADAIGMSTVPEVIAAAQLGVKVLGISTITNVCCPDLAGQTTGEGVAHAASGAAPKVAAILKGLLGCCDSTAMGER
ncbi:MAG TPA: purine-nucleoside phosphorylase [Caulifigura sp.]|nr:purine-nucleoside phosphorylase [Caulifigura sp.]